MNSLKRKGKKVVVRALEKSDFLAWQTYFLSMDNAKNVWDRSGSIPKDISKSSFHKVIKSQKNLRDRDEYYDLVVFDMKGNMVGTVSLMNVTRSLSQSAFLGYTIHNKFWGMGFGKESVLLIIDIAFRDLKLHRIEAGIEPNNRRSIFLARSIGLRKEGLKKRAVYLREEWQDLSIYSATCEEFGFKWHGNPQSRPR